MIVMEHTLHFYVVKWAAHILQPPPMSVSLIFI